MPEPTIGGATEELKRCSHCREVLPISTFAKKSSTPDGLQRQCRRCVRAYRVQYRAANRERLQQAHRADYVANKDARLATSRKWHALNRDKVRKISRQYYQRHLEDIRGRNREAARLRWPIAKQRSAEYRAQRRGHFNELARVHQARRKARKRNATGEAPIGKVRQRTALFGHLCYLCGIPAQAIDHVKPLSKGGANWPSNLRPICNRCNSLKQAQWPYEPAIQTRVLPWQTPQLP